MAVYNDIVFEVALKNECIIENKLDADILYFNAEITNHIVTWFREVIEKISFQNNKQETPKEALVIVLTTPGGLVEPVEKMVEIARYHYKLLYFVIPDMAMSAGTIFCMAGDKIYMDYSSSLGPIDPQVEDKEGRGLIPALGYIDKVDEFIEKSKNRNISPVEYDWAMRQDIGWIKTIEKARDLSHDLLKRWLVEYKFKDWKVHNTDAEKKGHKVTLEEKRERAQQIASHLSDYAHWHSHGRMIGMQKLKKECFLKIDDFGLDKDLQKSIRLYSDSLTDYMLRLNYKALLYSRKL